MPLSEHPGFEGFSHHTNGQCLLNEGVRCAQHALSNVWLARVLSEACPTCFHFSWYLEQPVIIWMVEAITHYCLSNFCCLPSSLSDHYPLWPLLTIVSQQAETTMEQWREEHVWDTEHALELAMDAGTHSCRRWGLPGSWQNARLSYSSELPTHKGNNLPFEQQG